MVPLEAVALLVGGLACAIWPYKLARFSEQWDSIGSKRSWDSVEPADWYVTVTRITGLLAVLIGIALIANV